ncbi:MAG: creatininase family protein [Bacillota bacterium]|nr:creatininase family protein [Bacillota bacterium]
MKSQKESSTTAANPACEMVLLPIGSFEQHGDHLPFGTDNYEVAAIAAEVARQTGAFLLPVQPISVCYEHHGRRGSIHYSASVFFRFLVAAGEALYSQGFTRLVYMCGHGGVFVLEPAVDHLNAHIPELSAIYVPAFGNLWDDDTRLTDRRGIHAGEMETSLMLYLHPELVDKDKAVDFLPDKPQHYLNYGSIFHLTPNGVWGNATGSSPDTGRWIFERSVHDCIERIRRSFLSSPFVDETD